MDPSISDTFHGLWSVENADRGERLEDPEDRLITGGTVLIDTHGRIFAAAYETRTGENRRSSLRSAGRITDGSDRDLHIDMGAGRQMALERLDDGRLRRTHHDGPTLEKELVLAATSPDIDVSTRRTTLLPPILFNTMPKSGSIFISRSLARGLGLEETKIAVSLFPDDLVLRDKLDVLARGNLVAQQHLPAREPNLRFLANRLDRMVVHVRDPRQATLSWLHHLDNFHAHRDIVPACKLGLEAVSPALPDDYFERCFNDKLDYLLASHYPQVIAWTEGWVEASRAAPELGIHITAFEDFVRDPSGFFDALLAFFEIPSTVFDRSNLPGKEAQTHFRLGRTDEWVDVFSDEQKRIAADALPSGLRDRFGW